MHAPARFSSAKWQPRCQRTTRHQPVTRRGQTDITTTQLAKEALTAKALDSLIPEHQMHRPACHVVVKITPAVGC